MCDPRSRRIVKVERMVRTCRYLFAWAMACAMCVLAHAQDGRVRLAVLDSLDDRPISDVLVTTDDGQRALTDKAGTCMVSRSATNDLVVHFAHTSYQMADRTLSAATILREGTWVVRLAMKEYVIGDVRVTRPAPVPVFQRADLHAADLLINDEGIWVLAYERPRMVRAEADASKEILRDVRLVLLDTLYAEVAACPVPEDVYGLRRDLRNAVVIEGTRSAYGVLRWSDGRIGLQPFGLEELRKAVLPWTDSIPGWVLGSNSDGVLPAFDHLAYDPSLDSSAVVCSVVDTFMMDLFRSEYKYMNNRDKVTAMDLAAELNVDKAVVAGYMSGFQHQAWFRPIYAPLFVVGDTLLVFDHAKGRLRKFTRSLGRAGEVPLRYLGARDRKERVERILQDRSTQRLYAFNQRFGTVWLRPIDPVTGALGQRVRVSNSYPERVQVHGDAIYYIYRPQGSIQKRTVYREALR